MPTVVLISYDEPRCKTRNADDIKRACKTAKALNPEVKFVVLNKPRPYLGTGRGLRADITGGGGIEAGAMLDVVYDGKSAATGGDAPGVTRVLLEPV